jgi:peptidoglycan glycosyltransferase
MSVTFEYNKSTFSLSNKSDKAEIAQTAIGQGKTTVTPLENALISATIANDGEMMTPYLVDRVESVEGSVVTQYEPQLQQKVIGKKMANQITEMMKAVVTDGTASSLKYLPYAVAGKTGTAEYDSSGTSHAWFVGFAPADDPQIVVSIVVEGAGTGSQYAVPIAQKLFQTYLGN